MRMDKLTTKFQMALADAQSIALGRDNQYVEPEHVMMALLEQEGGTARPLLAQAGVNINQLHLQVMEALDRLPRVEGTPGEVHISQDLNRVLNVTDKLAQQRNDQFISSELFLLAAVEDKGNLGNILRESWRHRSGFGADGGPGAGWQPGRQRGGRGPATGAGEIHHRSDRAGRTGQARSGHRARQRDSAGDPGAAAADQEQSRLDRRGGGGKTAIVEGLGPENRQ